jgi:hypothetical protein
MKKLINQIDNINNLVINNADELEACLLKVSYELLPWPIRVVVPQEKYDGTIKSSKMKLWDVYCQYFAGKKIEIDEKTMDNNGE